ncbi:MAG: TetR/AcrR family transcriptional regulator [Desulfovibrionaceae bacterium]
MRTVKAPEQRRQELMDAAEALFAAHGIDATSVNDIIRQAGVAKGTFYWYFKSKEALLDALVARSHAVLAAQVGPIAADARLCALEKLKSIATAHERLRDSDPQLRTFFHRPENLSLHLKQLAVEREQLGPPLAQILRQGTDEGAFDTPHPDTAAEFLLLTLGVLAHPVCPRDPQNLAEYRQGLQGLLERALGARDGSLAFLVRGF